MASKRNKLLIFLGLVTVAVSKSHNQRFLFEDEFKSKRTSASKDSANLLSAASERMDLSTMPMAKVREDTYRGYLSAFDEHDQKELDKISPRNFEDDLVPQRKHLRRKRKGLRRESVHHDSSDLSVEIDPEELQFEPQKVNRRKGKRKSWNKPGEHYDKFFSRRSGEIDADTVKMTTESLKPIQEAEGKVNRLKEVQPKTKLTKGPSTSSGNKISRKKGGKPKRKKVLRLRVRGQNNKTRRNKDKINKKTNRKTKVLIAGTSGRKIDLKRIKEVKIPEDKTVATKQQNKVVLPKFKPAGDLARKNEFQPSEPHIRQENKHSHSTHKQENKQNNGNFADIPESKHKIVTFYRRSGKKVISKHASQEKYPKPDWISMYKTENHDKDGKYYVLSFNYMGNKNHHQAKQIFDLPEINNQQFISTSGRKQKSEHDNYEQHRNIPSKETEQYPSEELNIGQLENIAGKFLERKRKVPNYDRENPNIGHIHSSGKDTQPINEDHTNNDYYSKGNSSPVNSEYGSFLEKQLTPTIKLKRKKSKKKKDAVWKLQAPKKKFPEDQWKHPKEGMAFNNKDSFKSDDLGQAEQKPNTDAQNYYVRSFIKLPSGENIALNLKNEELTRNKDHDEFHAPRKPLLELDNKGNGNYFMRMYKKVGNDENFEIQNYENPENKGYLSSLKLSWNDDDKQAHVEKAVDSRSFISPTDHSHSIENTGSYERGFSMESSEHIMQYQPHQVDDFITPLRGDKSYVSDSIPFTHRRKRSLVKIPQVTSHFKIGDSKIESNHTLEHKPRTRFFSKRLGMHSNNKKRTLVQPLISTQTRSRNTEAANAAIIIRERNNNVKSYYHKPAQARAMKKLKTEFNTNGTDIFEKYEKPSRDAKDTHVFHAYQIPNRNIKQAHDVTYFRNDKNSEVKIKISDNRGIAQIQTSHLTLNSEDGGTDLNNFRITPVTTIVQSPSGAKALYAKTNEEIKSSLTDVDKISQNSQTFRGKKSDAIPVVQTKERKTMPNTGPPIHTQFYHRTKLNQGNYEHPKQITTEESKRIDDKSQNAKSIIQARSDETTLKPNTDNPIHTQFYRHTKFKKENEEQLKQATAQELKKVYDKSQNMKPTIQARFDKTEPTANTETLVHKQFFHRTGFNKSDKESQNQPISEQSRRIDNKHLLHSDHDNMERKNQELRHEIEHHLEKTLHSKKRLHFNPRDISSVYEYKNKDLQPVSNSVTPQVPFHWDHYYHDVQPTIERNYPMYHSIPKTHFTCKSKAPGYYADPDAGCQVFHMCQENGAKHSFLCPNTTIFNQRLLVCDWHSKVNCEKSESLYGVNNRIYSTYSEDTKEHKQQNKKSWKAKQEVRKENSKYPYLKNENYSQHDSRPKKVDHYQNTEITSMPQYIVDKLKDKIPNAEIGKPKSITKSYSAIMRRLNGDVILPIKSYIYHSKKHDIPIVHVKLSANKEEKLIPDEFLEKQKAIKNSWTYQDLQKVMKKELLTDPEVSTTYQRDEKRGHYMYSPKENSNEKRFLDKSKSSDAFINNENSYSLPSIDEQIKYREEDQAHFAGRQKEKLIVVNMNRLQPDYESSEKQSFPELETTLKEQSLTKFAHPIKTHEKIDSSDEGRNIFRNEANKYQQSNRNGAKIFQQSLEDDRIPHYEYLLPPSLIQKEDGSRKLKYGFRIEDSNLNPLQRTKVFKLDEPKSSRDLLIKHISGNTNDPLAKKIKWRIAEIKSGVEGIGAQVGKILSGNNNDFKNVRVYELKPNSFKDEFQEIRLTPFNFERQSKVLPNSKIKGNTGDKSSSHNNKSATKTRETLNLKSTPNKLIQRSKNEKISNSLLNSNAAENMRSKQSRSFIAIPKLIQQVAKEIAPKYKKSPIIPLKNTNYKKNFQEKRTFDQIMQAVPPQSRRNSIILGNNDAQKPVIMADRVKENISPNKKLSRIGPRLLNPNEETKLHTENMKRMMPKNNQKYEIKYVPLIKLDDTVKARNYNFERNPTIVKYLPEFKKSEKYVQHIFVPKKMPQRNDQSFPQNPGKINIKKNNNAFAKQNPIHLINLKIPETAEEQSTRYNFDNAYQNKLISKPNYKEKFVEIKPLNIQRDNKSSLKTTRPHNQKTMRTFVVISKPVPVKKKFYNIQTSKPNEKYPHKFKTAFTPTYVKSNQDPSLECDDSASNFGSHSSFSLGKNGPSYDSIKSSEPLNQGNGNLKTYYNPTDKSISKCRYSSSSKSTSQDSKSEDDERHIHTTRKTSLYQKPMSKIEFEEPQQPRKIYTLHKTTNNYPETYVKPTEKTFQQKRKPVKLFDFQRNSRPALMKPGTSTQPDIQVGPRAHQLKDYPLTTTKVEKEFSDSEEDSAERSKRVLNGGRYSDVEKKAELKTGVKSNWRNKTVNSFPAARTTPQGKIATANSEESSESASRLSRYAAFERAAELKAEHMMKSKSRRN